MFDSSPALSPDGKNVAFISSDYSSSILEIGDLRTGAVKSLGHFAGILSGPVYSPDGRYLLLYWQQGMQQGVLSHAACFYIMSSAVGSIEKKSCDQSGEGYPLPLSLSPDGKDLIETDNGNGNNLVSEVSVGRLPKANFVLTDFYLTPHGELTNAFFSPDGGSVLLLYSPTGGLEQLWRYQIKTGELTQLTRVSDGVVAAAVANSGMIYYRAGTGTHIYSLDLVTRSSKLVAITQPTSSPDISVQPSGPIGSSPRIVRPVMIDHAPFSAFFGPWEAHGRSLCVGESLHLTTTSYPPPKCNSTTNVGWMAFYQGCGYEVRPGVPLCYVWADLTFTAGPHGSIIGVVRDVLYTTLRNAIIHDYHLSGFLQAGDVFGLRAHAVGLLEMYYPKAGALRDVLGNVTWCGAGISPSNRTECGA
jgi:hypothetical protein